MGRWVGVERRHGNGGTEAHLVGAVVALIADADKRAGAHERVADHAFAVACFDHFKRVIDEREQGHEAKTIIKQSYGVSNQ